MDPITAEQAVDLEDLARSTVAATVAALSDGTATARQTVAAVWTWRRAADPDRDPAEVLGDVFAAPWPSIADEAAGLLGDDDADGPVDLAAARARLDERIAAAEQALDGQAG